MNRVEKNLEDFYNNYDEDGRLVRDKTHTIEFITTTKFVRKKLLKNVFIPFQLIKGVRQARKILKKEQPNVIFSKGGYVSLPVVIASRRYKIPVVAHESDLFIGLANKLSKKNASVICTTFEQTANDIRKKGIYTGSPIKRSSLKPREQILNELNIKTNKPILVVTGGSLGSKFINNKIREDLKTLTHHFFVIHLTGKNNIDYKLNNHINYKQIDFTFDMPSILSIADIVVSRAGSNTIFELACLKKPMLLIPLPKGTSRGDQVDNAKYFNKNGYANFITQEELEHDNISRHILQTYRERDKLINTLNKANIQPANKKIIEIILETSKK